MAQTIAPLYTLITNYTQAEEDAYAITLSGCGYGYAIIYNTDLIKTRVWSGTAFTSPPSSPAGNLPIATTTLQGAVPATGTPSGAFLKDDLTWHSIVKADIGLGNVVNSDTTITSNITDSTNKRFITDAQQTVLGNTSNANSGDETTATIKSKLGTSSASTDGYLLQADWNTFNNKVSYIAPMLTQDNLTVSTNQSVSAGYSSVVVRKYTINSGIILTVGNLGILRIL